MKIAITADPEIPVPPLHYGGLERIVDMLIRSLVKRGHDVTLFANPESKVPCRLISWPGRSSLSATDSIRNAALLTVHVAANKFDLIHSNSRIAYLTGVLPLRIPKLMTYHREISPKSIHLGHKLSLGSLHFSGVSGRLISKVAHIGSWHVVHNGVPLATYDFKPTVGPDAPLVFLGRIEEIKGPHIAIEVAKRTGIPLVIAGNIPAEYKGWFDANVAPHIDDRLVRFVGPVDDAQKNALLGSARAFLMPISWEEPFGIVMTEAMACGTPVLGFRLGAVPEIVTHGETGFVVDTTEELAAAVMRCGEIDRGAVRRRCEEHFSDDRICDAYVEVYERIIAGVRKGVPS